MQEQRRAKSESATLKIVLATAVFSVLLILAVDIFAERLYKAFPVHDFLAFHNISELFSVVVSFSIFGIGWFTFSASGNRRSLLLASSFALVGYFDLFHTLSFVGMPVFISPNSTNKSVFSWEAARFASALGLLAAAFAPGEPRRVKRQKAWLAVAGTIVVVVSTIGILYFEGLFPPMFVPEQGLTPLKIGIEYLVIILFGLALPGLWRKPLGERDASHTMILCSIVLAMASELAFTLFKNSYDSYSLLGHAFKLVAFFLLYRGVFIVAVTRPYSSLRASEEALRSENEKRIRSETTLEQTNRELTVLHECNQAIARGVDESSLLDAICGILCVSGGYRMVWVGYPAEDEARSVRTMSYAGHEEGYLKAARLSWGGRLSRQGADGVLYPHGIQSLRARLRDR
ncbi:MAG TPA: MASE3 domain-containing protein [Rectinemataceae bacterium]|nr:MASE3 domain-containing protein [Rectinemataceae bacterium]